MPVVRWHEKTITCIYVCSPNPSILEERPLLIVWVNKLNRRVVVRHSIPASIDVLPIVLGHNDEILPAMIHAHHVLHRVCVWSSQGTIALPVCDNTNIKERFHDLWQLHITLQGARWVLKRVVVMIGPILFLEFLKELLVWHIDSLGSLCEVSKSIVLLSLSVDDLIASLLNQVRLISPELVRLLSLAIAFEEAWSVLLDIVIEEPLWCHSGVVTLWDFIIVWHVLQDGLSGQVSVEVLVSQLSLEQLVQSCVVSGHFFPDPSYCEETYDTEDIDLADETQLEIKGHGVKAIVFNLLDLVSDAA